MTGEGMAARVPDTRSPRSRFGTGGSCETGAVARSIDVASLEPFSGKSLVALGLLDLFTRQVERTGIFRPITRSPSGDDHVVDLLLSRDGVDMSYDAAIGVTYEQVHTDPEAALTTIVDRYGAVEADCDAVVIVGSDYTDVAGPTELTFNARIGANRRGDHGGPRRRAGAGGCRAPRPRGRAHPRVRHERRARARAAARRPAVHRGRRPAGDADHPRHRPRRRRVRVAGRRRAQRRLRAAGAGGRARPGPRPG